MKKQNWIQVLTILITAKFLLHLYLNPLWSFHRDELLYLALGKHLDWGYASVPAGIGFWAWFGNDILGGSVTAIRFIATFFGTATVLLTGLMAREFLPSIHSGKFAMILVGLAGLLSGAYLRPSMLFMPVVFDMFYWTFLCYLFLKFINTQNANWLIGFGVVTGFGLLNKYTVLMYLFAMLPGILLSQQRRMFTQRQFYIACGLALLIFSPNIIWQVEHQFPVFRHMSELASSQFVHVSLAGFFSDQMLFFLPALPIWLMGLGYLLFHKNTKEWRVFGFMYIVILGILLFFKAKSYYSLGAYPVLIAAGAAYCEQIFSQRLYVFRYILPGLMLIFGMVSLPVALPLAPPAQEVRIIKYLTKLPGLQGVLRWEDGKYYDLPQDFADMLGWQELAQKTGEIWQSIPNKATAAVYAENYGQAVAVEHFAQNYKIENVISFSDNYRHWLPDSLPPDFQTLIYINDELGDDMPGFFNHIEKVWELDMPLSRQHGDQIYLCRYPRPSFERINTAIDKAKKDEEID